MLLLLQSALFCLAINCTKPQVENIVNYPGTPDNNDSTMTDTTSNTDSTANVDTASNTGQYSWLALGDSYTIGQSVEEQERFPAQTIALLKKDSLSITILQYIATTGWTTRNLLSAIAAKNPQGPFDVVSLLIGVNDQYQQHGTTGYRERFTECLKKAVTLAGNKKDHVFVLSIPDYSVTPFAQQFDTLQVSKEIDEFNAINKAITLSFNISYTDITPLTREAKNDASLIAIDGLHPSGKEYAKWAALLVPQIENVLK
ncbi:MAG TPA: SGNH/GDSL hydrolase family protein [Parafilimonas sp.]|nr:SGNH/GDSL hydrolase family protein [Parafilimonas sp.]